MKKTFKAVIESASGGGAFVVVPYDVEATYGKKRVKVKATFDGVHYRGSIVRMGGPDHILPILKAIRQEIGKGPGDRVTVTVEADAEPRVVDVPDDFRQAINRNPSARSFFRDLSYTHKREYVLWINEAKRDETRRRRIARAVEMMEDGKKGR